jgi:hypothetical protein
MNKCSDSTNSVCQVHKRYDMSWAHGNCHLTDWETEILVDIDKKKSKSVQPAAARQPQILMCSSSFRETTSCPGQMRLVALSTHQRAAERQAANASRGCPLHRTARATCCHARGSGCTPAAPPHLFAPLVVPRFSRTGARISWRECGGKKQPREEE